MTTRDRAGRRTRECGRPELILLRRLAPDRDAELWVHLAGTSLQFDLTRAQLLKLIAEAASLLSADP